MRSLKKSRTTNANVDPITYNGRLKQTVIRPSGFMDERFMLKGVNEAGLLVTRSNTFRKEITRFVGYRIWTTSTSTCFDR